MCHTICHTIAIIHSYVAQQSRAHRLQKRFDPHRQATQAVSP
jgi:hypothetical protein